MYDFQVESKEIQKLDESVVRSADLKGEECYCLCLPSFLFVFLSLLMEKKP